MLPTTSAAPLPIVFHDDHFVAIHKPPGLLVHRSPIAGGESEFALQRVRDQIGQRVYTVHRLDRPTSGVLLFGLSAEAGRRAAALFEGGEVAKRYLAVVRGHMLVPSRIDYPLADVTDALAPTDRDATARREAVTDVEPLARTELLHPVGRYDTARYSLVALTPRHGRRHQLRRHLKHVFHPVVGDVNYGDSRHNRFFRDRFAMRRLLLHAERLQMPHPFGGEPLDLMAPLDDPFETLLRTTGLHPGLTGA